MITFHVDPVNPEGGNSLFIIAVVDTSLTDDQYKITSIYTIVRKDFETAFDDTYRAIRSKYGGIYPVITWVDSDDPDIFVDNMGAIDANEDSTVLVVSETAYWYKFLLAYKKWGHGQWDEWSELMEDVMDLDASPRSTYVIKGKSGSKGDEDTGTDIATDLLDLL